LSSAMYLVQQLGLTASLTKPKRTTCLHCRSSSLQHFNQLRTHILSTSIYGTSLVADMRRGYERINLKPVEPYDPRIIWFPRQRIGRTYSLNQSLITYRVNPLREAYRNLYLRHLLMNFKGKLDKSKVAFDERDPRTTHKTYFVESKDLSLSLQYPLIASSDVKKIGISMTDYLTDDVEYLFVHDGAVGSHRFSEVRVRVITDDPAAALFLRTTLCRVPLGDAKQWKHEITVWYTRFHRDATDPDAHPMKDQNYTTIDLTKCTILHSGNADLTLLKEAIAVVASHVAFKRDCLPLACHLYLAANRRPVLVFDPTNFMLATPEPRLVAAHGVFWNDKGLYPMFYGVTHFNDSAPRTAGDLVEMEGGAACRITQRLNLPAIIFENPKAVVFLIRDESNTLPPLSRVDLSRAVQIFHGGYWGHNLLTSTLSSPFFSPYAVTHPTDAVLNRFTQFLQTTACKAYVINVGGEGIDDKIVNQMMDAIADGTADNVVGSENTTLKLSTIPSLPGLQLPDYSKYFSSSQDFETACQKAAQALNIR